MALRSAPSSPASFLRGALRVGGAFLLSLLFWELFLRLTTLTPAPYQQHPQLGWTPRPHSRGFNGTEGWAETRFNEWGLRDRRIEPKQPGEFRILCLGDSYTVSGAIPEAETYPRQLERLLNTESARAALPGHPRTVRVINGGRVGINSTYSVGLAETYLQLFQPDWVTLQIRDYGETLFDPVHEFRYDRTPEGVKFYHRWHLEEMSTLKRLLLRSGVRDSAVAKLGLQRLKDLRPKAAAKPVEDEPPASKKRGPAAEVLLAVDETVRELRQRYPHLVLLHFPYGSPEEADLRPADPEETRWAEDAAREGLPLIPLRDAIARDYAASRVPPYGFFNTLPWSGHPNEHGNRLAAETLRDFFTRQ